MNVPDLRRLRYFIAVAEELHFGRAARRLNISQPPLSVQIRELERDVGMPLFIRSQRRVTLTEPGRVLLDEARSLIGQAEAALVRTRRAGRGETGQLSIGFVSTVDYSILPALVRRFRQQRPGVSLRLRELTADLQQADLLAGKLDLGLSIAPPRVRELRARSVLREPLIAAVPGNHRLARMGRIGVGALADDGFVLFPRAMAPGLYDLVIATCQRAGFAPRLSQEAIQMQTILGLVAAGLGVALVPACMANLRRRDVRYLHLAPASASVETVAMWHADNDSPVLAPLLAELPDLRANRPMRSNEPQHL
jgi:DNA-binding transcriptional LysR family regulator